MEVRFAYVSDTSAVQQLFHLLLSHENDAIYNEEFLCPDGIYAAIKRKQLIIAIDNGQPIAALRFYKRKTRDSVSLYQFAIQESHRGQHLLFKMLNLIGNTPIDVLCPMHSKFNDYYVKTGWTFIAANQKYNRYTRKNMLL